MTRLGGWTAGSGRCGWSGPVRLRPLPVGPVRGNGVRVKPAHAVRAGDEVRLRGEGREHVVVVRQVITKRVSASAAAACYIDNSPPPPPREEAVPVAVRNRGAGRPTKRERRSIEKLLGWPTRSAGFLCAAKTGLLCRTDIRACGLTRESCRHAAVPCRGCCCQQSPDQPPTMSRPSVTR